MNSKTWLIVKREFSTRIKKRSFIIMTLLGPLLFGGFLALPAYLASMPEVEKKIIVVDQPRLLAGQADTEQYKFKFVKNPKIDIDEARELLRDSDNDALLYIPSGDGWDPDFIKNNILLYGKKDISLNMQRYLEKTLEKKIDDQKLLNAGVDPEVLAQTKTLINIKTLSLDETGKGEKRSATPIKMIVGIIAGMLIYLFVFIYASQVMRGVIEEKSNRIVEVIISSVRPFQLMSGKIVGIGSVGFVQFLIWIVFSMVIFQIVSITLLAGKLDPEAIAKAQRMGEDISGLQTALSIQESISAINFPLILGAFVLFFAFGYILYSSLFAAIGSAVDNETDTQQFLLPVMIPFILALVVGMQIINNPDTNIAFWFSIIPLTSPIVMMVRLPFGVPVWELALSLSLLILGCFFTIWMASKIYRTGILMHGKKITYGEMFKWLKQS